MNRVSVPFILFLTLLTIACGASPKKIASDTPIRKTPAKAPETPTVTAQPMPLFELQHNWRIVETEGVDMETIAVVTLVRPELAGRMRLEIMPSYGVTPKQYAAMVRRKVEQLEGIMTTEPRGPDTDDSAGFIWITQTADPVEGRTIGHVVIRRQIDHPDRFAYCEGWWPETSDTFLFSPLMNGCASVRSPPWTGR